MKIAVLQFYDDSFKEISDITAAANERWCRRMGYAYVRAHVADFGNRHPCWMKLRLIAELLPKCDWLFYLDADALVTDPQFDLQNIIRFIEGDRIMAVCEDANGMNAGVLLVRSCAPAQKLIEAVINAPESEVPGGWMDQLSEQRTLEKGINAIGWRYVARFAQRVFNSYLYDLYDGRYNYPQGEWCEGDPVLHLPGVDNKTRRKVFSQFIHELHL